MDRRRLRLLERFATWLIQEAIPSGGLGPSEGSVVYSRHLADSLLFASAWTRQTLAPPTVLDVGTGVGLPGLPLAIAWPSSHITLLDRSVRRTDLVRRALWILGLDNVDIVTTQLQQWSSTADLVVCRAVASPSRLRHDLARLLTSSGVAVVGGSRRRPPDLAGYRVLQVPAAILGYPVWLLIMNRT